MCVSYHAVHSEVVVLGLQLYGVGVVVANLCVACQEQTLVVHDPVKHLRHGGMTQSHREKKNNLSQPHENMYTKGTGSSLTFTDHCESR